MPATAPHHSPARLEAALLWWARAAAAVVLGVAAVTFLGWSSGIDTLTRGAAAWPQMTPWTAALLATLGLAVLIQTGRPSHARVWAGVGLAVVAGLLAGAFLAEYATGRSFGLDQLWFPGTMRTFQSSWPGRPSPHTGISVLLMAFGVGLTHLNLKRVPAAWATSLVAAVALPFVVLATYLFQALALVGITQSTGMAITTAVSFLLLVSAAFATRHDRNPVAWILARPDGWTLIRMVAILAGPPILVALSRGAFLNLGLPNDEAWVASVSISTLVVGLAAFYLIQHEQKLLIESELLSRQRADAEARYRILADNAVDVVLHVRGSGVVWVSPSVEAAFGWPRDRWIGSDLLTYVHPDEVGILVNALQDIAAEKAVATPRCRIMSADGGCHWVDCRGKPYIDAEGNTDGVIGSMRIVDEQVGAQRQLKAEKERFESVVGKAPSAISVGDLQDRFILVNDAFCQLFGQKSVEEVIGRTEEEILPPDVLRRSQLAVTQLRAGDSALEEESIARGLENISVMTQRFPLHDAAGQTKELVTIRTDITHRKRVEQEAAERAQWQERIRAAIGDGRLLVYSQPIVTIATRETVQEELLVRLRDADTEDVLPPSDFLPQCERHGLMPVIDRYMAERAIDLARGGRHVCVNITGQTITDATTMSEILDALTTAGPDITGRIVFEITETTALASPEIAKAFSVSMRDRGCRVALDDFGTGYGTFTELRNLALYGLKIDLSFVQNMLGDRDDERVVNTIVFVAQTYGLTTIAEGVESEAVLQKLAEAGADRAQGYLFGKPQPIVA
ncbi:MAG: EAL domain-containing protein [Actinomycetia bacterium]|nr:EAL domain-containing protein [Actinomycetes bacterium]MCH9709955.1 EAL domain-containing protein [Actinomycetes bacterium]MCH9766755.1 EAL domain-containing protein [Actinomycetes bacterium]